MEELEEIEEHDVDDVHEGEEGEKADEKLGQGEQHKANNKERSIEIIEKDEDVKNLHEDVPTIDGAAKLKSSDDQGQDVPSDENVDTNGKKFSV